MPGLNQNLYNLIISRLDGYKVSSKDYQDECIDLVNKGIGGFILFGGEKNEVREFIEKLQSIAESPLLIASDIERGTGQQVEGATNFPPPMAVGAAFGRDSAAESIIANAVRAIADEAADTGINMPLIPVMDVNRDPDNPIICTRAFSDNPADVAWFGRIYIGTLEDAGLISCAKHFPGHGDTGIDSHISLPVISKGREDLMNVDIAPFREAVNAGTGSIMIGHLSVPALDSLPATLSKKIITGLLRTELGFEGLIITDALNMHALDEYEDVPVMCINAGADILLHPADAGEMVESLITGIDSGEIEEKRINDALNRIRKFRSGINNLQKTAIDGRKHQEIASLISDRSITLVKDTPGILPIGDAQRVLLVYAGDQNDFDINVLKNFMDGDRILNSGSPELRNAPFNETTVFALFTDVAAWKGSSGIRDEDIRVIKQALKKAGRSIVISFGSPYVLGHFMEADVLIAAYESSGQAQRSVIKCLRGESDFQGRLPVKLVFR
jgi:beta-glucosidase-like glycosyl hydrolase